MVVAKPPSPLGEPALPLWQLPREVAAWLLPLALALDARQRHRLAALVTGLLFARGRRTVTSPLRACLYVRKKDVAGLPADYGWASRTKLELAAQLVRRLAR